MRPRGCKKEGGERGVDVVTTWRGGEESKRLITLVITCLGFALRLSKKKVGDLLL